MLRNCRSWRLFVIVRLLLFGSLLYHIKVRGRSVNKQRVKIMRDNTYKFKGMS